MNKTMPLALGVAFLIACGPAAAVEASYKAESAHSADSIWAKIKGFCGIVVALPGVKCELSADGLTRTLTLPGDKVIVEKRESIDDAGRTYSYTILQPGPLPVANYHSTIAILPKGSGAEIVWSGHFDAHGASDADAQKAIEGIYKGGSDGLAK